MIDAAERLRRWRLALGGDAVGASPVALSADDLGMDRALEALYASERGAGLGASAPNVPRWLGDIRKYFPTSVVRVLQKDAIERLDLKRLLFEPEALAAVEPDVHLVGTLLAMKSLLPAQTRDTARQVVGRVVDDLLRRLEAPLRQAVHGALRSSARSRRPRAADIDWHRTIRANLRHYQREHRTVVPETLLGRGRRRAAMRELVLVIDQSGSMAESVVYSGVFGAALASLPAVRTSLVVFDTEVVDLTELLSDPVEVLFATQLGGGTDIHRALTYGQSLVRTPSDTIVVLVSDLYEGGVRESLLQRAASIVASGAQLIVLLALSDSGAPSYDHALAADLAGMGVPAFACTPDLFPEVMAAAISRRPLPIPAAPTP